MDLDEEEEVVPGADVERSLDSAPLEIHEAWICEDLIKHLLQVSFDVWENRQNLS